MRGVAVAGGSAAHSPHGAPPVALAPVHQEHILRPTPYGAKFAPPLAGIVQASHAPPAVPILSPESIESNDHHLVLCGSASRRCAVVGWACACRSGRHSRSGYCTPRTRSIKKGVGWTSGLHPWAATSSIRRSDARSTTVHVNDLARHVVAGLSQETDGFRDVFGTRHWRR